MLKRLSRYGINGFIVALLGMILLAYLVPEPGTWTKPISLKNLADYGISVIFFFYGLGLSREKFVTDLGNRRLQILVLVSTFLIFPLLVFPFAWCFAAGENRTLWLGIFFVAALPSTVSSSVIMVSLARGNVSAAIFCSALSSVLGILITPLWMSLFLIAGTEAFSLQEAFRDLSLTVLLPVVLGIMLHKRFGSRAEKHRKTLRYFDQSVVLLIVYVSFCDSFRENAFGALSVPTLALLAAGMVTLFFTVYGLVYVLARVMKFNREDTITAVFCSSKKSLMHGTAMGKVLFGGGSVSLGLVLLPIMLYHALQLIIVSVIANKKSGS